MGTLHEANPSIWVDDPADADRFAPLAGVTEADVCVVGSGIAGVVTAHLLQQAGLAVTLLEAGRLCSGVTAYTTAKITSLHQLTYADLVEARDEETARQYGEANEAGLAIIAGLVDDLAIDCDFERRPAYTYTSDPDELEKVEQEAEVARRLGLPASFTTETELPYATLGAVRFDDQAQFHPRKFCVALARHLADNGGRVHELSRVRDVDAGDDTTTVATADGSVKARHVVLATHMPFLDRGLFFAKAHPVRSYAIAIEVGDTPPPKGMYISAESPTRSLRTAGGDRYLIVGGESHKVGQSDDERKHYRNLEAFAGEHWPGAPVAYRWSAQDLVPVDGLPFVGPQLPGSNVYVATAFRKWGMANGAAAGRMITDHISGVDNPWFEAFDARREGSTITSSAFYKENANVGKRMVGDRLARLTAAPADDLGPGEGGIVTLDGDRVAAYRDDDGTLHALSPTCTHLGCTVAFNKAEKSWDCPCHGSRFGVDGRVIEGPALHDLDHKPTQ